MQLSHTRPVVSAVFDEPNLVSSAGLVPVMALARTARFAGAGRRAVERADGQGRQPGAARVDAENELRQTFVGPPH
jgi:hypothetical protein